MRLREFGESEKYLREALARDPRDWRSLLGLGEALVALHRDPEAVSAYRQAVSVAPSEPLPRIALGRAMLRIADSTPGLEEARSELQEAARMAPSSPAALLALGQCLARLNQWRDARRELEE